MSEVEKMYKLANIEPQYKKLIECKEGHLIGKPCQKCPCINCDKSVFKDVLPPFTAEKLLKIEAVIFKHNWSLCELCRSLRTRFNDNGRFIKHYYVWLYAVQDNLDDEYIEYSNSDRKEALAGFVNHLWQDLTEKEKQQIKEILK